MAERRPHTGRHASRRDPGQYFLRSKRLAADIVRGAEIGRTDYVLEIGPGSGRLTIELARVARHVLAVELDSIWAERLQARFAEAEDVGVVEADALRVGLPSVPFRVVGNLPFSRTTALLRRFFDDPRLPLERVDAIVEWGCAVKRARIFPSTLLGATWGAWWRFSIERRLPASAFAPSPSVDAALLVATRRTCPLVPINAWQPYRHFVRSGFERGLREIVPKRQLRSLEDALGFDRGAAPRDLDVQQWASLFRAVRRPSAAAARVPPRHEPL